MKELPAELLDAIICHLSHDRLTLNSCSLVCRSWVKPAQTYLFEAIEFSANQGPKASQSCKRLVHILQLSPHLSFYVCRLSIVFDYDLLKDKYLQALLRLLSTIRYLMISSARSFYTWQDLPHTFVLPLTSLIANPMFEELRISGITFTPSGDELTQFLRYCANSIQTLILSDIRRSDTSGEEVAEEDGVTVDAATNPVELTKLRELVVQGDLPEFGGALKMPNLLLLQRELASYAHGSHRHILYSCAPKELRTLVLQFWDYNTAPWVVPSFQNCAELRFVLVGCWQLAELDPCIQIFRSIPSSNFRHLEYFLLDLRSPFSFEHEDMSATSLWGPFVDALVPLLSQGRLKTFLIIFSCAEDVDQQDLVSMEGIRIGQNLLLKDLVVDLRTRFRALDSKGALELRLWDLGVDVCMDDEFMSLDYLRRMMRVGYRL